MSVVALPIILTASGLTEFDRAAKDMAAKAERTAS